MHNSPHQVLFHAVFSLQARFAFIACVRFKRTDDILLYKYKLALSHFIHASKS